jgi:TonB family protein
MRSTVAVAFLLTALSTFAGDAQPVPLKEAREVEELNAVGRGLMGPLGARPTECPPDVIDRATRVSVLVCGAISTAPPMNELTANIDNYMTAHGARATERGWSKQKAFSVRDYAIGGVSVTAQVSAKRRLVAVEYLKQCFPPPEAARELVTEPSVIAKTTPRYPEAAQRDGVEADLLFEVLLRPDGTIGDLCLMHSTRPGMGFEDSAAESIRGWRYQPARLQGTPIEFPFTVFVSFRLH